jgi:hypothetical protein
VAVFSATAPQTTADDLHVTLVERIKYGNADVGGVQLDVTLASRSAGKLLSIRRARADIATASLLDQLFEILYDGAVVFHGSIKATPPPQGDTVYGIDCSLWSDQPVNVPATFNIYPIP